MIKNPKYRANKKNGGLIPAILDERALHVPIGCGKCMECRKQKAREWQVRLMEDIKENKGGRFITLTFNNESYSKLYYDTPDLLERESHIDGVKRKKEIEIKGYDKDNAIATRALRLFLERWRKKYKKTLRHWLVTELGHQGTENIHMHGIVWQPKEFTGNWLEFTKEVERVWAYGYVWRYKWERGKKANYVNEQTVNYCVKYINKADLNHKAYKSIVLTSPGIGANYMRGINKNNNKYNGTETDETYKTRSGHKIALPIYYRNKLYTDEEKEKLWLNKLDKKERWVGGERVDISKGEEGYYKLLDWYRRINKQLGYGDDKVNWTRAKYEHERRIIMQRARIGRDYPKEWDKWEQERDTSGGGLIKRNLDLY